MFRHLGHLVAAGCIFVAAAGSSTSADAQAYAALTQISAPAVATGVAKPLLAWVDFCRRFASECAVDPNEPATIRLTPKVWQMLTSVNRKVNTTVKPMTDEDHWGVTDHWDLAEDGYGDCEDFQLLKRKLLAEAGLPRRAMRMAVVIDEQNQGHAVLMVRTDRGDFVLDNKTDAVLAWFETGYVYVKRESQDAVAWTSLGGATSPTVTANR